MPFPKVDPMIETFLEPTRIFLFGKPFPTLEYNPTPMSGGAGTRAVSPDEEFDAYTVSIQTSGEDREAEATVQVDLPIPPGPVEQAFREVEDDGIFARIYGFSFEGHYYKMPRPLLFLVRGDNARSRIPEETAAGGERQFNTRFTGVEGKDWQFGSDIRVWAVDKHDIAVCLDLEIGRYDEVLLQSFTAGQEESGFRSAAASRSALASRSSAVSFRSAVVGPHQDR
jgi:hypothetical protein